MSLKAKIEAIVYAAEMPVTLEQIFQLVKDSVVAEQEGMDEAGAKSRVRATLEDLAAEYGTSEHGIELRQVAGGYRMSTKPEQHDMVRAFAKSLKPPIRLSLPALETLAVIAYKQPVTVPEISEIRGVDSGPQAHHHRGAQGGDRAADPLQDHQGIPDAVRAERRQRTAQHGRIRKAGGGVIPKRFVAGSRERRRTR